MRALFSACPAYGHILPLVPLVRAAGPHVCIRTFGQFDVYVNGTAVTASAWQSRRARDLLRILVARRGRPVPRPELCEMLWPDDDPARTAHRLSVLLSIVRTVTGPNALLADTASVALDLSRIHVDVEAFLDEVATGLRLDERGSRRNAQALLAAAVRRYTGEPFEDSPYEDHTIPLREEARRAYLRAVRLLAEQARDSADTEGAVSYLHALLAADPYDEPAHRALVAHYASAGHHGEASRALTRYREAMLAIGVRPPTSGLLSA